MHNNTAIGASRIASSEMKTHSVAVLIALPSCCSQSHTAFESSFIHSRRWKEPTYCPGGSLILRLSPTPRNYPMSLLSWLTIKICVCATYSIRTCKDRTYQELCSIGTFPVTKVLGDSFDKKVPIPKRIGKLIWKHTWKLLDSLPWLKRLMVCMHTWGNSWKVESLALCILTPNSWPLNCLDSFYSITIRILICKMPFKRLLFCNIDRGSNRRS